MPLDITQARAVASRMSSAGGRVGAGGAMLLRRTAYAIEGTAKALAPVDTGFLRGSITTTVDGDGRFGSMSAVVGPTAEYGIYQEYGTSTQPGQPYLGPAFDTHAPGYAAALADLAAEEL